MQKRRHGWWAREKEGKSTVCKITRDGKMFPDVTEVIIVWSPRKTKKYFYTVINRDSPWDAFSAACAGYLLNIPAAKVTTLFKSCLPPLGSISILSSLSSSSSSITAYRWRLLPRPRLLKKTTSQSKLPYHNPNKDYQKNFKAQKYQLHVSKHLCSILTTITCWFS